MLPCPPVQQEGRSVNDSKLSDLLKAAKRIKQTSTERERQRQSFTYGNTKIENRNITRDSIEKAARVLASDKG